MRILERVGVFQTVAEDAAKVTIMVGGNVRDEVCWMVQTNGAISKFDFHIVLRSNYSCHPER